jgi:hypothetical protein
MTRMGTLQPSSISKIPGLGHADSDNRSLAEPTENEKDSIGSAHAEAPSGMPAKASVSTPDRILFIFG